MSFISPFFSTIDAQLYALEQKIYFFISSEINQFSPFTILLLFLGGVLTSLNPCLISIFPLSVSYLYSGSGSIKKTNTYIFIAGITSSIIIMLLISVLVTRQFRYLITLIPIFSSIVTILIGLNLLKILNIAQLFQLLIDVGSFNQYLFKYSILYDYFVGFTLGLSSAPCSSPILLAITLWLFNYQYLMVGIIYIFIYLIGYMIPILFLINLTMNYSKLIMFNKLWNTIIPLSGSVILGLGIFTCLEKICL